VVEGIPYSGNLKVFVQIDNHVAKHINRVLRSLRPGGHHSLNSSHRERMSIGQSDRLVMEAGHAFSAIPLAIGVDSARFQLLCHAADIRLANDVTGEIHFPEKLPMNLVVDGVRSIALNEEVPSWDDSGDDVGSA
jgi:hypothetical protein